MRLEKADVVQEYSAVSDADKLRLLASLARNLTASARGVQFDYRSFASIASQKLLAFNDLQEQISTMTVQLLEHDDNRYPDDVFVEVLFDLAEKADVADELAWAFTTALAQAHVHG